MLELIGSLHRLNQGINTDVPLIHQKKFYQKFLKQEVCTEMFSTILRFLSNMVHINREAQNYLLNKKYLVPCLSFTGMNEIDLISREWTVILVRNLCESNQLAQTKISQLKVGDFDEKV